MKIRLMILLLLGTMNSIFSQEKTVKINENEILIIDDSETGKVINGVYICNKFDWKINIPENYTITKEKELRELEKQGNATLKKNLPASTKIQNRTHLIGFELNSNNTFSASFNPLANTTKISLQEHEKLTLSLLKKSYGQFKKARCEFKTEDVTLGKYQFYKITIQAYSADNDKLIMTQIYYNSYIKNHLFGVLISYNYEEEGKKMEDNFLRSFNK